MENRSPRILVELLKIWYLSSINSPLSRQSPLKTFWTLIHAQSDSCPLFAGEAGWRLEICDFLLRAWLFFQMKNINPGLCSWRRVVPDCCIGLFVNGVVSHHKVARSLRLFMLWHSAVLLFSRTPFCDKLALHSFSPGLEWEPTAGCIPSHVSKHSILQPAIFRNANQCLFPGLAYSQAVELFLKKRVFVHI